MCPSLSQQMALHTSNWLTSWQGTFNWLYALSTGFKHFQLVNIWQGKINFFFIISKALLESLLLQINMKSSWLKKFHKIFVKIYLADFLQDGLVSSLAARRSNQSILKEISPEYSLEGLMLKLKLQYFGHLTQRTDSSEKTLMLGKIQGRRRRG